jgi:predicted GH43/DUF377 family glycosyl hydrolase
MIDDLDSNGVINAEWERLGLIFSPNTQFAWSLTHAMVPTPLKVNNLYRIFYSGRNKFNQSSIGWFDIDLENNCKIVEFSKTPVLEKGELGCFDDNGVTPSCIIKLRNGELALYYIGWNPGSTTRVNLFGGLAISKDNGKSFIRWSKAPILERNKQDPYINTAPWVVEFNHEYRMYYVSGSEWIDKDSPRYNIKVATSQDGYKWERLGQVVLDFSTVNETALARPFVIFDEGIWKMWVSSRVKNYSIVYAESLNGLDWTRKDGNNCLKPSNLDYENVMTEYGVVIKGKEFSWLLYNGNNYGKDGILIARKKH